MHRGSPAAAALKARSPSRSAPLGSPRTTTAIPSEAASTIRSAGASAAAVTATTAPSCARSLACSGTDLRVISFIFSSTRRHTISYGEWSSDVCSSDLQEAVEVALEQVRGGANLIDVNMDADLL